MGSQPPRGAGAASPTSHTAPLDEGGESFAVVVELVSWVNRLAGGSGTGSLELVGRAHPGETIRNLLHRIAERHERLREALWDPDSGNLGPHIEVVFNHDLLGIEHDLDSPLRRGDRLTLSGQYTGD